MLSAKKFQQLLFHWFDTHGRKHLPWQHNKTPYRVWISEIMLQQTQVNTVIPYYLKFMQQFPTIASLANAHEDTVLKYWAGLGYYSRARHLHLASKKILHEHQGEFPATYEDIIQLPGIGASTAGAILSIAFQQATPILDGNVKRVLARMLSIATPLNHSTSINTLWKIAKALMPSDRTADYTQAMMDLGAVICIRNNPLCHMCPVKSLCTAYKKKITHLLPVKKDSKKIPTKEATFLIFKHKNAVFLEKRPAKGIWGGLWSLPELIGQPEKNIIQQFCKNKFNVDIQQFSTLKPLQHTFTHYRLNIYPVIIQLENKITIGNECWYTSKNITTIGLPKPIQTLMSDLL